MDYNKRIDDNFLRADHVDGEVLQHTDLNELENVVKLGINANYEDIQKLQDGTLSTGNAEKLSDATLSKYADEALQNSDTKIPTSMQTKQYVDNAINSIDLSGYAPKVYVDGLVSDTVAIYDSTGNGIVDNAEKVNNHTVDKDVPSDAKFTDTLYDDTEVRGLISGLDASKVDKVNGKGLSTNDYTDAEKNKLSGIANGAQVNAIEKIKVNGTQQTVTNKVVDISVPTQLSQLSDDATHRTVTDSEKQTWNNKGSYSKPSGGIPKTDLSSAVQTSLGKADSAIQDVSDKEDKANKVTSLSSSSTDIQYPGAKTVYDSQEAQNEVINALETELENTKEELDRYKMLENALPHITGTGTELTLDNTANAGMTIDLEPNTSQGDNPSPDYPQDIHVVSGDNEVVVEGKNILTEQPTPYSATAQYSPLFSNDFQVNLKSGENYTLSIDTENTGIGCYFQAVTGISLTYKNFTCDGTRKYVNFTATKDLTQINRAMVSRGSATSTTSAGSCTNVMISKGTATDTPSYEPHEEQVVNIPLGDLEYCKIPNTDYKDEFYLATASDTGLTAGKWYLKKNISKVVLDGTEDYVVSESEGLYRFTYSINDLLYINDRSENAISNYYNSSTTASKGVIYTFRDRIFMYPTDDTITTETAYKAWLSTHNTIVYYVLATPTYILLNNTLQTALNTLKSKLLAYKGQTNISQVNNDLPFEIVASAIYDMNNLIDRVATLETE